MSERNDDLFYKHSGQMGLSVPVILVIGLPVIVLLSAIYSALVVYCPVVGYVNILFLGGYVYAGGFVLATLARQTKCRNPGILLLLGAAAGVVGVYAAWVFFISMLFGNVLPPMEFAFSPFKVFDTASTINANGWWGPSGIAQWALVSIEAAIIVGGLAMFTYLSIDREVFCEECNTWCEPFETMHLRPADEFINTPADQLNHLELLSLEEAETTEYPRLVAEVLQCSGCQMTQAIRFKKLTQVMEEGELNEHSEDIPGILMQRKTH